MAKWDNVKTDQLLQAILTLRSLPEAKKFFRDLLTEGEIIEFANRWQAARLLDQKVPYTKIEAATGLSSATVARIAKWLKRGAGGYRLMIKRLHHAHHTSTPAGSRVG